MNERQELMNALADGELQGTAKQQAMELLKSDPTAYNEFLWAQSLRATLRESCKPVDNEEAWSKCQARLAEIDRTRRTERFVGKNAWALCGIFALALVVAGVANRNHGAQTLANTQVASLINPLAAGAQVTPDVPDLDAARSLDLRNFQITSQVGGYLDGRPFVRYALRDNVGLGGLAIAVVKGPNRIEGVDTPTRTEGVSSGTLNGVNCVSWTMAGHTIVLFGERSTAELTDYANDILTP